MKIKTFETRTMSIWQAVEAIKTYLEASVTSQDKIIYTAIIPRKKSMELPQRYKAVVMHTDGEE